MNGKLGAIRHIGFRLFGIVATVQEACDGGTTGGGNPKVGRSSIEDHAEGLGRGTELDFAKILIVANVGYMNGKGEKNKVNEILLNTKSIIFMQADS